LQTNEILVGLTPKEQGYVVHRAKWFKWNGNFLFKVWMNGCMNVGDVLPQETWKPCATCSQGI
jgi:hypothetical protein